MEVRSMTTELARLDANVRKQEFTGRDKRQIHEELKELVGGPCIFQPQPTGFWLLLIAEPRAKELKLSQRRFEISDPRQAPEALRKAFPQN